MTLLRLNYLVCGLSNYVNDIPTEISLRLRPRLPGSEAERVAGLADEPVEMAASWDGRGVARSDDGVFSMGWWSGETFRSMLCS